MKHLPRSYGQSGRIVVCFSASRREMSFVMMDLIFVAATLAFFLISIAYIFACDRLR
jgi:hypothetical protein